MSLEWAHSLDSYRSGEIWRDVTHCPRVEIKSKGPSALLGGLGKVFNRLNIAKVDNLVVDRSLNFCREFVSWRNWILLSREVALIPVRLSEYRATEGPWHGGSSNPHTWLNKSRTQRNRIATNKRDPIPHTSLLTRWRQISETLSASQLLHPKRVNLSRQAKVNMTHCENGNQQRPLLRSYYVRNPYA